jgi:hypothetical protein
LYCLVIVQTTIEKLLEDGFARLETRMHQKSMVEKGSDVSFSKVKSDVFETVTTHYSIKTFTPTWDVKSNNFQKDIGTFNWSELSENNKEQRKKYIDHLSNISWPEKYKLFDTSCTTLSVSLAGYCFNGSIDIILAPAQSTPAFQTNQVCLAIEVKKAQALHEKKNQCMIQATIEHMCASINNEKEQSVLTLLTDLIDEWCFFYFGPNKKIYNLTTSRVEAIFLLENMFPAEKQSNSGRFPDNFLTRLTWDDFIGKHFKMQTFEDNHKSNQNTDRDPNDRKGEDSTDSDESQADDADTKKSHKNNHKNDHNFCTGEGHGTGPSALLFGGDVANNFDLLEFITDPVERKTFSYELVLNHVMPFVVWKDGTMGIKLEDIAEKEDACQEEGRENGAKTDMTSYNNNCFASLSEQNMLQHNAAQRS